jgi:HK97 family phage prohead protease
MFHARQSRIGDETLEEIRDGYLPGMSVGFRNVQVRRGEDGVREVVEAALIEVSLVTIPAYDGARVLAVRDAYADAEMTQRIELDEGSVLLPWWMSSNY